MNEISLEGARIGCAMTGSFCTFKAAFDAWRQLKACGAELTPVMSFNAAKLDTRFYPAAEAVSIFEDICGKRVIHTIEAAEPIGPKKLFDLLIVAPCTGNTLSKIARGTTDTPVALAVKSHLRNGRAVLIAVSTNDALSGSAENIARLLDKRNLYFVPFGQDAPQTKPFSCVARFEKIPEAAKLALRGAQIQPILVSYD